MSIHKSLHVKSALMKHRNVLTRNERIELTKKSGKRTDGQSVFGLPKTKVIGKLKKKG